MKLRRIIVASGNEHKIEEIKKILKGLPVEVVSKNEVGLEDFEVIEDGDTLEENAIKKAIEISQKIEGVVLADDTGLFVEKLGGEPGIYSARYAGENVTYLDNNKKLLKNLKGIKLEDRQAEFRTVIAIVLENKKIKTLTGICKGKIALEPKGDKGFGYDPLFIVDGYDRTFSQLGEEIKNEISHRVKALRKLRNSLEEILKDE
ncbi:XTP/dITP diphosphatase [Clostridium sp. D2Q-14]|uniref:XTP/dITP diphosphatase n=1 Tax=Anaeromonas gelatinilytica TaxID=2683194 RepID=UPI00193B6353|nr:XTP/dITP diphosphatase [Anaeromonas gelatinilytica]MBS4535349.1 XTP/dITP diphosphatase [Anaeromonas gelatinilytica]